jgi:hypothetical protein
MTEKFLSGARKSIRETAEHQEFFRNSKLNRQIAELKHTVTRRKQPAVNGSNRQKIQKRPRAFFVPNFSAAWQPQGFPE